MSFTLRKGDITIDGKSVTDAFAELAHLQEIFAIPCCGKCGNTEIVYKVRNVDDNDFYELHCTDLKCRAYLAFGQHKKGGTLFPKRKDKDGKFLPNNGWVVYKPSDKKD